MIVTSTESGANPAARTRRDAFCDQLAAGDPGRRRRSGREDAPEIAEPGRAEQRVADRVEHHVAVGVAVEAGGRVDGDAPEGERRAGPERMPVVADPHARRRPPGADARRDPARVGERRLDPPEIVGQGHLEVGRFAGDRMDRDSTGLEQGGLVGPRPWPGGREGRVRGGQHVAPDPLGRLRGGEPGAVHGLHDAAVRRPASASRPPAGPGSPRRAWRRPGQRRPRGPPRPADAPRRGPGSRRSRDRRPAPPRRRRPSPGAAAPRQPPPRRDPAATPPPRSRHLRRGRDDHDPGDARRAGESVQRPGEERPAADLRGELVRRRPSACSSRPRRRSRRPCGAWRPGSAPPLTRTWAGRRSSARRRSGARA